MKINNYLFILLCLSGFLVSSCCEEQNWYEDKDGDGFGDAASIVNDCEAPAGYVADNTDMDDTDTGINPNSVWSGATMTFTKDDNADWTLEANQDRITDNVWITRADNKSLFNIKTETVNETLVSPADTEWALGSISDGIGTLTFDTFGTINNASPKDMVDVDMVIHLMTDNVYMDIKITSWSGGGAGGFAYERSTED